MIGGINQSLQKPPAGSRGSAPCRGFAYKGPQHLHIKEAPVFGGIENLKILLSGRLYWPCMP